jgi:hypothetical protein
VDVNAKCCHSCFYPFWGQFFVKHFNIIPISLFAVRTDQPEIHKVKADHALAGLLRASSIWEIEFEVFGF